MKARYLLIIFFMAVSAESAIAVFHLPADLVGVRPISFGDQVDRHVGILDKFAWQGSLEQDELKDRRTLQRITINGLLRTTDSENIQKALVPYAIAEQETAEMQKQGYMLNDLNGNICKPDNSCVPNDIMMVLFYLSGDKNISGPAVQAKLTAAKSPRLPARPPIRCSVVGL